MNLSEALGEGLQVTVIGLVIVFSVLIILMLVMMAMKAIFYRENKPQKELQPATPSVHQNTKAKTEDVINEEELIAVLTAAVAASLNTSTYHLNIKSYRRIGNSAPSWNQAGLRDVIDGRF